ncbi:MAG: hypothetical protein QOF92_2878 [Pseudonocardiales bacterium]|jgi:LCP family protein required for cell wall assembly|nr:hypothetical protein [Pseudonocardiales bacterium]MDT4930011.1 hypothetical protein [Pseudonocardiales bacterium]MDT4948004.1 hypothetical protein [Pseudonocardiales bacterium]
MLSAGLLLLAGYYWQTFRSINNGVPRLQNLAVGQAPSDSVKVPSGKDMNILLVGNDDRTNMTKAEQATLRVGSDGGSKSTDTMMIMHVPADGSKATLISLPRDSYVSIPGHGMNRLNSAYVFGYNDKSGTIDEKRSAGANLLIESISNLTGLTINHYIQVSLLGFYEISNAIGGIPVNLCNAVDDSPAANQAAGLDGGSGLVLSKGMHTIKGVTALEFVRQRHFLPGGDLDRVRRQQYFLTAAFRQVASAGILTKLNALGSALKRNVYLDPGLDLLGIAQQLEHLTANNIIGKTIPTNPQQINGQDVLAVDKTQVRAFLGQLLNKPTPSVTPSSAKSTTKKPASTSPSGSASKTKAIDATCIN